MEMQIDVDLKINKDEVLNAFHNQVQQGLDAIGLTAEGYAKDDCPVDTGRLRNSITYATESTQGTPNSELFTPDGEVSASASASDYEMHTTPAKNEVVIGTNVEYAAEVELLSITHKTGKAHFLKDAASGHADEYRAIMEAALR